MKKFYIIGLFVFILHSINCQIYFNKHFSRDSGYFYFSSILEDRNIIYVLVHFNDPTINNRYGSSGILTFDSVGHLLSFDTIRQTNTNFYAWPESLQKSTDSTLFFVSHDTSFYHIMEYNINSKKINSKSFKGQLGNILFLKVVGVQNGDNSFIVTNHNVRRRLKNGKPYKGIYDMMITKVKSNGSSSSVILKKDTLDIVGWNIIQLNNGNLGVAGYISNVDYEDRDDYLFQQFIYIFDTSLNLLQTILSPESVKLGWIGSFVESRDGSKYCASSERKWYIWGGGNYYEERPAIIKYSPDGNYAWTKAVLPQKPINYDLFNSICFSADSASIIAVGKYNVQDDYSGMDSTRVIVDKGLISKLDLNGNLIWNRTFLARDEKFNFNSNDFLDIKRINTEGYILCGTSDVADLQNRQLQGWLMKVDEEGCLIPNCHLVKVSKVDDNFDVKIFPNPVNDYLSVLHGYKEELNLELTTINGQVIKYINNINSMETNIIYLGNLLFGEYILKFRDKLGILKYSTPIIIGNQAK